MTKTEKELEVLVKPIVEQLGYQLYDVEYVKEGSEWFLRVFIDSLEKTIDLDDCEKVSNLVSDMLDKKDPIATSYNLEVSSCGLERHLREVKHFEAAIGKKIELKLYTQCEGSKLFIGEIVKVNDETITILDDNGNEITIDLSNVSSAKILFNWEE
ncbi:MAG: ribosome maturation factor RimP [Clostridia bacterium]|nr:ribosome maturation factor RimP [Clostridia bacterium]